MEEHETIQKLKKQDIVYHYTDATTALEHILPEEKLKLSLLDKSNDPMEYKNFGFGAAYWTRNDKNIEEKVFKAWNEIQKRTGEKLRFVSFCRNEKIKKEAQKSYSKTFSSHYNGSQRIIDNLGCTNSRMWSQYGEGNQGICLAFSIGELEEEIKRKVEKSNAEDCFHHSNTMSYKELPIFDARILTMDGDKIQKEGIENYLQGFIDKNWETLFFTKHRDYRDENEHRIVLYDPSDEFKYIDISSSLEAIIAGDRFNEVYEPLIENFVNNYEVIGKKIHWEKGGILLLDKF